MVVAGHRRVGVGTFVLKRERVRERPGCEHRPEGHAARHGVAAADHHGAVAERVAGDRPERAAHHVRAARVRVRVREDERAEAGLDQTAASADRRRVRHRRALLDVDVAVAGQLADRPLVARLVDDVGRDHRQVLGQHRTGRVREGAAHRRPVHDEVPDAQHRVRRHVDRRARLQHKVQHVVDAERVRRVDHERARA